MGLGFGVWVWGLGMGFGVWCLGFGVYLFASAEMSPEFPEAAGVLEMARVGAEGRGRRRSVRCTFLFWKVKL